MKKVRIRRGTKAVLIPDLPDKEVFYRKCLEIYKPLGITSVHREQSTQANPRSAYAIRFSSSNIGYADSMSAKPSNIISTIFGSLSIEELYQILEQQCFAQTNLRHVEHVLAVLGFAP